MVYQSDTLTLSPEVSEQWQDPFGTLRAKWAEVPSGSVTRANTADLLAMSDQKLRAYWLAARAEASEGESFPIRGWYFDLYRDALRGRKVLDVGAGLGFDGVTFAQSGARVTFVDIVENNIKLLRRLCWLFGVKNAQFLYMDSVASLHELPSDFDVVWCQGSLIHAPAAVIREEAQELVKHLRLGGRWIELAYPKARWEREGRLPFEQWGKRTDGEATPWAEWYDLDKLRAILAPAEFDVVLEREFHDSDFVWFDLIRRA